jgi:hypothetical protein
LLTHQLTTFINICDVLRSCTGKLTRFRDQDREKLPIGIMQFDLL